MTQENILARYTILQETRRGTAGAVYAARDRKTGAVVALKRLDPALLKSDPALAARFLKQARAARRLKHPNIAAILDAGEAAGTAYAVMELPEGESLRKVLDKGPLPLSRVLHLARDIASALAHAHLEGVVHGALDASSIVVLPSGAAKIADFGPGSADHRDDVLSLGGLLYEMLAHQPPPRGAPPPPSELNPLVPRALDAVVLSMLAAQPAARMAGVPVLLAELQRLEEALGLGSAPRAAAEPAPAAPPSRPEPTLRDDDFRIRPDDFDHRRAMMERESRRERSGVRPVVAALAVLLAVLGIGYATYTYYSPDLGERALTALNMRSAPPAPPLRPVEPEVPAPPKAVAALPDPIPQAEPAPQPAPVRAPEIPVPSAPTPVEEAVKEVPKIKPRTAPLAKQAPRRAAQLILSVSPRGDLYVNGKHHGTTPPVTTFDLEPGMHRIEIRSGSRKPYLTYMTVHAGEVRRIRHDFNARPSRPPA